MANFNPLFSGFLNQAQFDQYNSMDPAARKEYDRRQALYNQEAANRSRAAYQDAEIGSGGGGLSVYEGAARNASRAYDKSAMGQMMQEWVGQPMNTPQQAAPQAAPAPQAPPPPVAAPQIQQQQFRDLPAVQKLMASMGRGQQSLAGPPGAQFARPQAPQQNGGAMPQVMGNMAMQIPQGGQVPQGGPQPQENLQRLLAANGGQMPQGFAKQVQGQAQQRSAPPWANQTPWHLFQK